MRSSELASHDSLNFVLENTKYFLFLSLLRGFQLLFYYHFNLYLNYMASDENKETDAIELIRSCDPQYPSNLICELCRKFYGLGWVCGFSNLSLSLCASLFGSICFFFSRQYDSCGVSHDMSC